MGNLKDIIKRIFPEGTKDKIRIRDLANYAIKTDIQDDKDNTSDDLDIEITDEYLQALQYINTESQFVFITGKAGTGKTQFIRFLRSKLNDNIAILAYTGVAAQNCNGQTIHSFFQFPPRLFDNDEIKLLSRSRVFSKLDIIIIDEISMVRADLLDAIDYSLKLNRGIHDEPFGGVRVVAVGDLYQLPPIVKYNAEHDLINSRYKGCSYFFSANSLPNEIRFVELTKVFRQHEEHFLTILNNIREGSNVDESIKYINDLCLRGPKAHPDSVCLVPKNKIADRINLHMLNRLNGEHAVFESQIEGNFDIQKRDPPASDRLVLKQGARVMLTTNNKPYWVNGDIGHVTGWTNEHILVEIMKNDHAVSYEIPRNTWENVKFKYDKIRDKVIAKVIGKFIQFPVVLAWAITIHKSQGKSFDRVFLDIGDGAFASGQLYVALSRCRSLDGLHLRRPLSSHDVIIDPTIRRFYQVFDRRNQSEVAH